MNSPIDEVRRLRGELAERDAQLAELRGLVQEYLKATPDDQSLERERAAYERGRDVTQRDYEDGFTIGHDVALGAHEEARPFVAGIREGFDAGYQDWQQVAETVFADLHQKPNVRELHPQELDVEREEG